MKLVLRVLCAFMFVAAVQAQRLPLVAKWSRFEASFQSTKKYSNPPQEVRLAVVFTGPSGQSTTVDAFWDGGQTWRVRFSPGELGKWIYSTACSDTNNYGLEAWQGRFVVTASAGKTRFDRHGPITVSQDGHFLVHDDGTPFFWLADTAWNAALLSWPNDLRHYTEQRLQQKFTAVQFVTTQWRASPKGDVEGQPAFVGREHIIINPAFFRRMDQQFEIIDRAGLLSAPVMLWAIGGGSNPNVNPGFALSDDQAILLARYMVARWGAYNVLWILAGDGDYRAKNSERWKRIGRAVFGDQPHAPVTMHPGGMQWVLNEFKDEKWYDVVGYQSGHGDDARTLQWLTSGPPAKDWKNEPPRPFINLEPPYEYHIAYQSKQRITPEITRRAAYWSLLTSPTAGVTYGGHGVWGWDNGTKAPTDHPGTGVPLPWEQALRMPAAEQMRHLSAFFQSINFWRLRPAPEMLAAQPGKEAAERFVSAARTEEGDLAVVYVPKDNKISLVSATLPKDFDSYWFNPRDGTQSLSQPVMQGSNTEFATPGEGDWVLVLRTK